MKRLLLSGALLAATVFGLAPLPATAQVTSVIVASCGTAPSGMVAGVILVDQNGRLCTATTLSGDGDATAANQVITNTDLGAPGSTACATDTGSCNINALLQRLAQRLTSAIAGTAVTFPTTPLIASGNGVVVTPVTEAASAVAPSTAVAAAESCRVLQASAANVYKVTVAIAATTGYVMIFNATSAPGDGAVSPAWPAIRVVSDGTSGWADVSFNPPLRLGTGATVCFSSTGPFTKTASATAAIGGLVK